MIVRIATEGQYELDGDPAELNELDQAAVDACESGDEARFQAAYARMLEYVRGHGRPVDEDQLTGSDVILPPPDVSIDEAKDGFSGEGLIPG